MNSSDIIDNKDRSVADPELVESASFVYPDTRSDPSHPTPHFLTLPESRISVRCVQYPTIRNTTKRITKYFKFYVSDPCIDKRMAGDEGVVVGGLGGHHHIIAHLADCFSSRAGADITIVCRDAAFQCHKVRHCKELLVRYHRYLDFISGQEIDRSSNIPVPILYVRVVSFDIPLKYRYRYLFLCHLTILQAAPPPL